VPVIGALDEVDDEPPHAPNSRTAKITGNRYRRMRAPLLARSLTTRNPRRQGSSCSNPDSPDRPSPGDGVNQGMGRQVRIPEVPLCDGLTATDEGRGKAD
jgi:hypothetical protein